MHSCLAFKEDQTNFSEFSLLAMYFGDHPYEGIIVFPHSFYFYFRFDHVNIL